MEYEKLDEFNSPDFAKTAAEICWRVVPEFIKDNVGGPEVI